MTLKHSDICYIRKISKSVAEGIDSIDCDIEEFVTEYDGIDKLDNCDVKDIEEIITILNKQSQVLYNAANALYIYKESRKEK